MCLCLCVCTKCLIVGPALRRIKLWDSRIWQNNNLKNNPEDQINYQPSSSASSLTSIYTANFSSYKNCKRTFDWLTAKDTGKQVTKLTCSHKNIIHFVNRLKRVFDFAVIFVSNYFPTLNFASNGLTISQNFLPKNIITVDFD